MKIEISRFTIESYDEVFALWQQCEGVGLSDADSRERIQVYLNRNPGMSFLASTGGKVVGTILAGHDGRRGYIHHLAFTPSCRRKDLARQLVNRCMEVLADSGIQKCHIFIFNSNADGRAFWKAMWWTPRSDIGVISKTIEPGTGGDS
jgi:putative acetyltransferase